MRKISTEDLRQRQVINLCNGEILGYACELEIDIDDGRVISLIVPQKSSFPVFSKKKEYIIPWRCIECIGDDTVLVRIPPEEVCLFDCKSKNIFGR